MAKILPKEYRQLEYIQSSGGSEAQASYINTNYKSNYNTKLSANVIITQSTKIAGDMGTANAQLTLTINVAANYNARFGTNNISYSDRLLVDAGEHIITTSKDGCYIDDTLDCSFSDQTTWASNTNLYLFKFNGATTNNQSFQMKWFKIWDNDTLVRNFIPAKRISDSEIGMYDLISKQFFTNSGTGTFTAGPIIDVDVDAYDELEYIQSSGTQYIDTGLIVTTNYAKIKAKITPLDWNGSNPNKRGWGVQGSSDKCFTSWDNSVSGTGSEHPDGWLALGSSWYFNKSSSTFFNTTLGQPYEMDFTANNGIAIGSYAGESFNNYYGGTLINSDRSIYLFDCNAHYVHSPTSSRIYYFYIETAEGIRNLIPVKRRSDSAIGMVDTLTDTFYANAGTGTFIPGPSVNGKLYSVKKKCLLNKNPEWLVPEGYTQLEYIHTEANAWIDTDVSLDSFLNKTDSRIVMKLAWTHLIGTGSGLNYQVNGWGNNPQIGIVSGNPAYWQNYNTGTEPVTENQIYTATLDFAGNVGILKVPGFTDLKAISTSSSTAGFRIGGFTGSSNTPYENIYEVWIYQDGLIHHYIPCKNGDGVIGMYDVVDDIFKSSASGTSFTAGSEIPKSTTIQIKQSKLVINNPDYHHIDGYTPLDYIGVSSTVGPYIDTGYKWTTNNAKIEIDLMRTGNVNASTGLFGSQKTGVDTNWGIQFWTTSSNTVSHYIGSSPAAYSWTPNLNQKYSFIGETTSNHTFTFTLDGVQKSTGSWTGTLCADNTNIGLFTLYNNVDMTTRRTNNYNVYKFKLTDNDTLVRNFIPMKRNSDNVLGMYDLCGRRINIFDKLTIKNGKLTATSNGAEITNALYKTTDFIPVESGKTYTIQNAGALLTTNFVEFDENKQFLRTIFDIPGTYTLESDVAYVRLNFSINYDINTCMLFKGDAVEPYEPYDGFYTNAGTDTFTAGNEIPRYNIYNINKSHFFIGG